MEKLATVMEIGKASKRPRCAASQPPGTSATQVYTGHETDTETGLIYVRAPEPHGTACLTTIR